MVDSLKGWDFRSRRQPIDSFSSALGSGFQFLIYYHRKSLSWDPGPRIVLPLLSLRWDLNDVILAVEDINSAHLFFLCRCWCWSRWLALRTQYPGHFTIRNACISEQLHIFTQSLSSPEKPTARFWPKCRQVRLCFVTLEKKEIFLF